jgi:Fic family protein
MARRIPESELEAIVDVVRKMPGGAGISEIQRELPGEIPTDTLRYRLRRLVEDGRLLREGERRWTRYFAPATPSDWDQVFDGSFVPVSSGGKQILVHLGRPPEARQPVGYDRSFIEAYRPGESSYLGDEERALLERTGRQITGSQPAGTYARQLLDRLLIDLSWNSSRLEGNTYSLLDTRRLISFSTEAEGKDRLEAQMILNHKDAIEFLVESVDEIGFNRYSILNLHALLANNLLPDPAAPGRLRRMPVAIQESTYVPLEVPQVIEECFDIFLEKAGAIEDPFEQSFFTMVHLPYLQPFDDVNRRVSRLAANISLIKANLCPLSFVDVPRKMYTQAVLGIYELQRVDLLRDVFLWAYQRSSARYAAIRQSIGEPDPFRLRYREAIRELVSEIVRASMNRPAATRHVSRWALDRIDSDQRERFREVVESELLALHEGNFARYRISPSEFDAWAKIWR